MKFLLIIMSSLLVVGCATPTINYVPTSSTFSKPPVNEITTVGVGELMLKQGSSVDRDILVLDSVQKNSGYTVPAGNYQKIGSDEKYEFFAGYTTNNQFVTGGLFDTPVPGASLRVEKGTKKVCVVRPLDMTLCDEMSFKLSSEVVEGDSTFQQTLIYSGKVGSTLNISYREFNGSLARPAYSNDVVYDLADSNIIGYQGAKLEVIEATNQQITYKVIKNFN